MTQINRRSESEAMRALIRERDTRAKSLEKGKKPLEVFPPEAAVDRRFGGHALMAHQAEHGQPQVG